MIFLVILIAILSSILFRVINDVVNYTPQDLYTMTLVPIQNLATAIEQMTPKNLLLRGFFHNSKQLMWSVK